RIASRIAVRCRSPSMDRACTAFCTRRLVENPDRGAGKTQIWSASFPPTFVGENQTTGGAMSSYSAGAHESDNSVLLKLFALFAGITVPVVMIIGLFLAISAHNARDDARHAAATAAKTSAPSM